MEQPEGDESLVSLQGDRRVVGIQHDLHEREILITFDDGSQLSIRAENRCRLETHLSSSHSSID